MYSAYKASNLLQNIYLQNINLLFVNLLWKERQPGLIVIPVVHLIHITKQQTWDSTASSLNSWEDKANNHGVVEKLQHKASSRTKEVV